MATKIEFIDISPVIIKTPINTSKPTIHNSTQSFSKPTPVVDKNIKTVIPTDLSGNPLKGLTPLNINLSLDKFDRNTHKLVFYYTGNERINLPDKLNTISIATDKKGEINKIPLYDDTYKALEYNSETQKLVKDAIESLIKSQAPVFLYKHSNFNLPDKKIQTASNRTTQEKKYYQSNFKLKIFAMDELHKLMNKQYFVVDSLDLFNDALINMGYEVKKYYDPKRHILVLFAATNKYENNDFVDLNPFIIKAGVAGNDYDIPLYGPDCTELQLTDDNKKAIDATVDRISKLDHKLIIFKLFRGLIPTRAKERKKERHPINIELNKYAVDKLNELFKKSKYHIQRVLHTQEMTDPFIIDKFITPLQLHTHMVTPEKMLKAKGFIFRGVLNDPSLMQNIEAHSYTINVSTNKPDTVHLSVCNRSDLESEHNKKILDAILTKKIIFINSIPDYYNGGMDLSIKLDSMLKDYCELPIYDMINYSYILNRVLSFTAIKFVSIDHTLNEILNNEANYNLPRVNSLLFDIVMYFNQWYNLETNYKFDKYLKFISQYCQFNSDNLLNKLQEYNDVLTITCITLSIYNDGLAKLKNNKSLYDINHPFKTMDADCLPSTINVLINLSKEDKPSNIIRILHEMVKYIYYSNIINEDKKPEEYSRLATKLSLSYYLYDSINNVLFKNNLDFQRIVLEPLITKTIIDKIKLDTTIPQSDRDAINTMDDVINAYTNEQLKHKINKQTIDQWTTNIRNILPLSQIKPYHAVLNELQEFAKAPS